ncbi:MAG: PAS domain S-box protein [Acidobacteria bacterium]|nr:PAS domain S-box protein [Acidobacteriota bacterium]
MLNVYGKTELEQASVAGRVQASADALKAPPQAINPGAAGETVEIAGDGLGLTTQNSEGLCHIIVEQMNEGAAMLTLEGTVLFCNRRLAKMVSRPYAELRGASFLPMLHEDERQGLKHLLISASVQDVRIESKLVQSDGALVPVRLTLSLVSSGASEKVVCLVVTDLTELRHAKSGLYEQAEIFEQAQDAILIRDFDSRLKSWNRGAVDVYGWTADEVLGKVTHNLFQTIFPEPLEAIMAAVQAGRQWEGDLRHIRRDGKEIIVASRWSLLQSEEGEPVAILEVNRDITQRIAAEIALKNSEESYRKLAELVPQLVWKCTPEGLNSFFNQRWVDYTGLTLEQSYGSGWITPFHPEDKAAAAEAWSRAVETGAAYKIECRLRAADGSYRWFLMKGVPAYDDDGTIVEWVGTCTDIDALKQLEQERAQASELLRANNQELESRVATRTRELAESVKSLEMFAYAVSHDLRAPLRHIDGFLTLFSNKAYATLDDKSKHYIDRTLVASRRMANLIDDLLQFSRARRTEIHNSSVDLNAVVQEVFRELETEIGSRKIEWLLPQLPTINADKAMLLQVVENLVANALKFTRGRETAKIEIASQAGTDNEVVFYVRDNGVGFDMRYTDKLFQVFQRLHSDDEFEGTGIGLAICRTIVERYGGRIWAEGVVGEGTTIYFRYQAIALKEEPMNSLKPIWLVDDNSDDVELMLSALDTIQLANRVIVMRDGSEVIDRLESEAGIEAIPIMILLDIKMPKVDGIEVLRRIKSDSRLKILPVVMFSSSRQGPDVEQCYALGANAYMVKPMETSAFFEAVKAAGIFWAIVNERPELTRDGEVGHVHTEEK